MNDLEPKEVGGEGIVSGVVIDRANFDILESDRRSMAHKALDELLDYSHDFRCVIALDVHSIRLERWMETASPRPWIAGEMPGDVRLRLWSSRFIVTKGHDGWDGLDVIHLHAGREMPANLFPVYLHEIE